MVVPPVIVVVPTVIPEVIVQLSVPADRESPVPIVISSTA